MTGQGAERLGRTVMVGLCFSTVLWGAGCSQFTPIGPAPGASASRPPAPPPPVRYSVDQLSTTDPAAAWLTLRGRMIGAWNEVMPDLACPMTAAAAAVNDSAPAADGSPQNPRGWLELKLEGATRHTCPDMEAQSARALIRHGWVKDPRAEGRQFMYDKGAFVIAGRCSQDDCIWTMTTPPAPVAIDASKPSISPYVLDLIAPPGNGRPTPSGTSRPQP